MQVTLWERKQVSLISKCHCIRGICIKLTAFLDFRELPLVLCISYTIVLIVLNRLCLTDWGRGNNYAKTTDSKYIFIWIWHSARDIHSVYAHSVCSFTYSFPLCLPPFPSCFGISSWIITVWMMKYNYEMLCQLHRLYMMIISLGTEDAYLIFPLN